MTTCRINLPPHHTSNLRRAAKLYVQPLGVSEFSMSCAVDASAYCMFLQAAYWQSLSDVVPCCMFGCHMLPQQGGLHRAGCLKKREDLNHVQ